MQNLVLHSTTTDQLDNFINNPSHAVLITGPDGIGKTAIAEAVLSKLINVPVGKLANYPHYLRIAPMQGSISIDAIRDLQKFLQLKTIGTSTYRRAVLIEHAQGLTTEAQNAFLKLLEEPPADTLLVLSSNSPRALLPTIRSRLQVITVHVPAESDLQSLTAGSAKDETELKQAYFLSGGLPGLLVALLNEDETHPLIASVASAKDILQKQPFERLAMVDALSKQKESAHSVLEALERIAQTGLTAAAQKNDPARIKQWHRIRKNTLSARQALEHSANAKLVLSNLFLNL